MTKLTASHVKAALRMKYAAPQYAVLEEVRNSTGMLKKRHGKQPRYADMIAMGLWPSIGLEIMGFEVKVSRTDWLAEISDDKKAVAVSQYCDRWYLVTPDESIVKEGELPPGWGWMVIDKTDDGFDVREVVRAPALDAAPITREFLASLLRNATTSNQDYIEVQSKIMQEVAARQPLARLTRSAIKTNRRASDTIKRAAKRQSDRGLANLMMQG